MRLRGILARAYLCFFVGIVGAVMFWCLIRVPGLAKALLFIGGFMGGALLLTFLLFWALDEVTRYNGAD
jgi:hypothetical protein